MNQDQVKQNLLSPAQWLRMLLMFGYLVALWVLSMVLLVIVITQTVVTLIVGEANPNLRQFGVLLAEYVRQVINFVVYGTEERPFPFAPFPASAVEPAVTEPLAPGPSVDRTEAA
jgi:type IV secretory pathway VirB3-like protein